MATKPEKPPEYIVYEFMDVLNKVKTITVYKALPDSIRGDLVSEITLIDGKTISKKEWKTLTWDEYVKLYKDIL